MQERRKEKRLKNEHEVAVTVVDDKKKPVKGKSFNNKSKNISVSGAQINSSIFLPADTLIMIKIKLKNLGKIITTIGKIRWTKDITDKSYESGVEFIDTPGESVEDLEAYISQGVDIHKKNSGDRKK